MSEQNPGEWEPGPAPFAAESAVVRARLADLAAEAEELRTRSRDLLRTAASRHIITAIDQRVHGDVDTGRHALEPPVEFDPTPYDPSEDADDSPEAEQPAGEAVPPEPVGSVDPAAALGAPAAVPASPVLDPWAPQTTRSAEVPDGGDAFAAAPASDPVSDGARLPPVPVEAVAQPLAAPEPDTVLTVQPGEPDADDRGEPAGATIIEFAPRAGPEPLPADVELAFGAPEPTTDEPEGATDPIAGIAASERTVVPPDWDGAGADDEEDAFAKFFSADVEPEPAQRWLLNE